MANAVGSLTEPGGTAIVIRPSAVEREPPSGPMVFVTFAPEGFPTSVAGSRNSSLPAVKNLQAKPVASTTQSELNLRKLRITFLGWNLPVTVFGSVLHPVVRYVERWIRQGVKQQEHCRPPAGDALL